MSDNQYSDTDNLYEAAEKLLLKQARLTMASPDKRSANKYEILPELLDLFQAEHNRKLDELLEALPKESRITAQYSTSEVDRLAYDLAYNQALKDVREVVKSLRKDSLDG